MTTRVLTLPGYQNSGSAHWQTRWEQRATERGTHVERVQQADWDAPVCADWAAVLIQAITAHDGQVVIAAHSLGCLLTAHIARHADADVLVKIKGALLVAPPDPTGVIFPSTASGFSPEVNEPFPFKSIVIASNNDEYGSIDFAQNCAHNWGSELINLGARGHINGESGLADWPEAWSLLMPWLSNK